MGSGGGGGIGGDLNPMNKLVEEQNRAFGDAGLGTFLTDPLDLSGSRAADTREEIRNILVASAQEAIDEQERQFRRIEELYRPFYDAATGAIPEMQGMVESGEMPEGYQTSKLAQLQMKRGTENIKASMAKGGLLKSSATQQRVADLASGIASEEAERAYGGRLSQIQLGADAGEAVSAAGSALSGNVSSLYGNLGANLNQNTQAYGAARQATMQGVSNTLSQMAAYSQQQG